MSVQIRYARSGDAHIAYEVEGEAPLDLLELSNGTNISIDETEEEPHWERYVHRLASFSRLIRFDMRGVGLSDPLSPSEAPTLESMIEDALAVLDAAGAERVAVLGPGFGGAAGILLAATHPERVKALVLVNSTARWLQDDDYPHGFPAEAVAQWSEATIDTSGASELPEELNDAVLYAASLASDPAFRPWWSRASRRGASPAAARALSELYTRVDVRSALSSVSVPTLVVHRREQVLLPMGHARYLADHISGAELVTLPGADSLPFAGDIDELIDPIEQFLTGERQVNPANRVLATIMFTDIVGSTEQVAQLGDRRWDEVLTRHDSMVHRQIERFRGRLVKRTGDGVLLTFDGPARAISCAISIVAGARQLGIMLRVGVHSGEIEVRDGDIGGIAVHIASRVADAAEPGEVFVSRTVTELVAGSGIAFADRGVHSLRGVPGQWQLLAVVQR
jgi:pimeloyl-ACP methyl ester carboxylesterase/class 3 adenylate cyclase